MQVTSAEESNDKRENVLDNEATVRDNWSAMPVNRMRGGTRNFVDVHPTRSARFQITRVLVVFVVLVVLVLVVVVRESDTGWEPVHEHGVLGFQGEEPRSQMRTLSVPARLFSSSVASI